MEESILKTIKSMIGYDPESDDFNVDIIVNINSSIMVLNQLGVGKDDFVITGSDQKWSDFIGTSKRLEAVKSYIYIKCKLVFDPPASSVVIEALNKSAGEYEWRLRHNAEFNGEEVNQNEQ